MGSVEKTRLWATDVEILRQHYAKTLKTWRQRFMGRLEDARRLYDDRFCRMWEFYLAASEVSFRFDRMMVFQMQLSKGMNAVPITRDYMLASTASNQSLPPRTSSRSKAS
jgi:cyclopropane-fatty-acyl-phospholipid synthase